MRYVFWLNEPKIALAPLIHELAEGCVDEVYVVTEWGMDPGRVRLGWPAVDHGQAKVWVAPDPALRRQLEITLSPNSVHFFAGVGVYPATRGSMIRIRRRSRDNIVFAFSEPWDPVAWKGILRRAKFTTLTMLMRRYIDRFLAAGDLSATQFASAGFDKRAIYPFGYFLGSPEVGSLSWSSEAAAEAPTKLIFAGQLISRKAPVELLNALAKLEVTREWRLHLAGTGPLEPTLREIVSSHSLLRSRVELLGPVPNRELVDRLDRYDVLVLPSRFDGWGAVVNEALARGCRCLVSDMVGARGLVESSGNGSVFVSRDWSDLARALEHQILLGPVSPRARALRVHWAMGCVAATAGADYFRDLVAAVTESDQTPKNAPWFRTESESGGADA